MDSLGLAHAAGGRVVLGDDASQGRTCTLFLLLQKKEDDTLIKRVPKCSFRVSLLIRELKLIVNDFTKSQKEVDHVVSKK